MQQQEVPVRQQTVDQTERRGEVHAVVVVAQTVETCSAQRARQPDSHRQSEDRRQGETETTTGKPGPANIGGVVRSRIESPERGSHGSTDRRDTRFAAAGTHRADRRPRHPMIRHPCPSPDPRRCRVRSRQQSTGPDEGRWTNMRLRHLAQHQHVGETWRSRCPRAVPLKAAHGGSPLTRKAPAAVRDPACIV